MRRAVRHSRARHWLARRARTRSTPASHALSTRSGGWPFAPETAGQPPGRGSATSRTTARSIGPTDAGSAFEPAEQPAQAFEPVQRRPEVEQLGHAQSTDPSVTFFVMRWLSRRITTFTVSPILCCFSAASRSSTFVISLSSMADDHVADDDASSSSSTRRRDQAGLLGRRARQHAGDGHARLHAVLPRQLVAGDLDAQARPRLLLGCRLLLVALADQLAARRG